MTAISHQITPQSKPSHEAPPSAGDVGRRVARRRAELGLSIDDVAGKAGIDPGYLRYFEKNAEARLSVGSMLLLALALKTDPIELQGGDVDRPTGGGRAGRHPSLETLTPEQCDAHLSAGGVGRVVYLTDRGPVALPVNYEYTDGEIVFSTDVVKASVLEAQQSVGFEVDRVDEAMSEGWSVVASGSARRIDDLDELVALSSLDLEAWAGGARHGVVAICPVHVTGRVIIHRADS